MRWNKIHCPETRGQYTDAKSYHIRDNAPSIAEKLRVVPGPVDQHQISGVGPSIWVLATSLDDSDMPSNLKATAVDLAFPKDHS